jgi:uncharacterized protein (TIGR02271 family)
MTMFEQTPSAARQYDRIHEGMDALDRNGDKIGKVGETLAGGRYFNVDAGLLGMKEFYVPFDAVTEVRDDDVYLNVTRDRLDDMGWDRRPEEQAASRSGMTTARGAGAESAENQTLQLREEELRARTEQVETGRVTIGKEVVEEQKTLDVPVSREEVVIERHPVEHRPADSIGADTRETITVPVREERVEVEKTPVVYEEVGVDTRQVTETRQVSETVRREEARIERQGDVPVQGWDEAMPRYRQQWQQRYGTTGGKWEEAEPAYRYAYDLRRRPEYAGRSWNEVEPSVRREWEQHNPNSPWDRARDRIRDTWDDKTS